MNIAIFNRKHYIRRFNPQTVVNGYLVSTHEDFVVDIHVHPAGSSVIQALPEGERSIKRLEGHTTAELRTANQGTNTKGDLLYYDNEWYECVSTQKWGHTLLSHTNYQFTLVPIDGSGNVDLTPPIGNPVEDNSADTEDVSGGGDIE